MLGNFSEDALNQFKERCPAGQWRFPAQTGICTPKQAVLAKKQTAQKDRTQDALRNRLEALKRQKQSVAKQQDNVPTKKQKLVQFIKQRFPAVVLDSSTAVGVMLPDGKWELLQS